MKSFALLPRVLDEQHPSRPVIIQITKRTLQRSPTERDGVSKHQRTSVYSPVYSSKGPVTLKMFPFDDVIMNSQIRDISKEIRAAIALTETPSRPSFFPGNPVSISPPLYLLYKMTCWIWCMCLQLFNPCVGLCLIVSCYICRMFSVVFNLADAITSRMTKTFRDQNGWFV